MKRLFLSLQIFVICFTSFSQSLSSDTLHWTSYRKLAWEDFKGTSINLPNISGQTIMLMLAKFQKQTLFLPTKTTVETVFDRKNSWATESGRTDQNLKYYQVLFDLYEVGSRKLRKDFKETKFGLNPNKLFQEKYNSSITALNDRTKQYMSEISMGTNLEVIEKWDLQIQSELKELDYFIK